MIDYNDGNWHGWVATEDSVCPTDPRSKVEVLIGNGTIDDGLANEWDWCCRVDPRYKVAAFVVREQYIDTPPHIWIKGTDVSSTDKPGYARYAKC